ncbi:MAG: hypothetical protein K2Y32_22470 [Candidatus Obscuribacterales bacterium]|nr:hypothetical protein [Candidatus Obscuribacterales bacterium]
MKTFTDEVLGRSMNIALVAKPAANAVFGADADWVLPVNYETKNSPDLNVRMHSGQYAVRVMSRHAVDLLIHVEGQLRSRVSLPAGINYVQTDGDGANFYFLNPGEKAPIKPRTDAEAIAALAAPTGASEDEQPALLLEAAADAPEASVQIPLQPVSGAGIVHIVARFAVEDGPGFKPPAQEYEAIFQMRLPSDHDEYLASAGLLHMVPPPQLINPDDEVSFEPSKAHRPSFVCTCTGCRQGGSFRNF